MTNLTKFRCRCYCCDGPILLIIMLSGMLKAFIGLGPYYLQEPPQTFPPTWNQCCGWTRPCCFSYDHRMYFSKKPSIIDEHNLLLTGLREPHSEVIGKNRESTQTWDSISFMVQGWDVWGFVGSLFIGKSKVKEQESN